MVCHSVTLSSRVDISIALIQITLVFNIQSLEKLKYQAQPRLKIKQKQKNKELQ